MKTKKIVVNTRKRNRVIKQCCICGIEFDVQPSKAERITSCENCRQINRKPSVKIECEYCKQPFVVKGYLQGIQKYCSNECKWNGIKSKNRYKSRPVNVRKTKKRINKSKSPKKHKICLECGTKFTGRGNSHYCTKECFLKSKIRQGNYYECAYCGEIITDKRHKNAKNTYFCSHECNKKYNVGENHPLYNPQRRNDDRGCGWDKLAEEIRRRDNYQCQRCGIKQKNRAHDVHHIEPYRISQNNHPDNLITLCNSCHKIVEHSPFLLNSARYPQSQTSDA